MGSSAKDDFNKLWQAFDLGISSYDQDDPQFVKIMQRINPMLLISHPSMFSIHCIPDPMDPMFPMKEFVKLTDELKCCPPVPLSRHFTNLGHDLDLYQDLDQDLPQDQIQEKIG